MQVCGAKVVLLCVTLILQVCYNTMPIAQPTNDYLRWCNKIYKNSEDPITLAKNAKSWGTCVFTLGGPPLG
jgi:hypothetical protein